MRHRFRAIANWIYSHKWLLVLAIIFTVFRYLANVPEGDVSADVEHYNYTNKLRAISLAVYGSLDVIAGFCALVVGIILSILTGTPIVRFGPILFYLFFAFAIFMLGNTIINRAKRSRWRAMAVLGTIVVCNAMCGLSWLMYLQPPVEATSQEVCENFVSDVSGIRLTCFEVQPRGSEDNSPDVVLRLFSTQDGGQTWVRQAHMLDVYFWDQNWMSSIVDGFNYCDCSNIKKLSDEFFWFWKQRIIAVTHDGGSSWYVTQDWDVPYRRGELLVGDKGIEVDDVVFENEQRGCARFTDVEFGFTWFGFVTDDGGQTWDFDGTYLASEGCKGRCECIAHWL